MALGWLMNLDFAGSGVDDAPVVVTASTGSGAPWLMLRSASYWGWLLPFTRRPAWSF